MIPISSVVLLAQTVPDGTVDLIQLGFVGIALLWFALGKVHPDSTVRDLREQLAKAHERADTESKDAKAVRDAVIKDVVPVMALYGERSREIADLGERLLAVVLRKEG